LPKNKEYYILSHMTLQQMYELGIEMAMKADPRGIEHVKKLLEQQKKAYEELPEKKKKFFDLESLKNPYSDSRILFGSPKTQIKTVLAGIDAGVAEVLLADRLTEKGKKIDAVVTHHPSGHALASLYDVMDLQVDVYAKVGIPVNVAHALIQERKGVVQRRFAPLNHNQAVDAARLLDMPLLALHTIWDNLGDHFMRNYLEKKYFDTVGELFEYINELPEFVESTKGKTGPQIVSGSEKSRAGKVVIFFTGGTNPSKELYVEMAKAGIGTIVDMHMPEEALTELRKLHINVIDTGHMASDSIGANMYFDALEKQGIEVVVGAGFIRVKRSN